MNKNGTAFLETQQIIILLFIVKFIFFLIFRRYGSKTLENNPIVKYRPTIYRATLVSWIVLIAYLVFIRLILGWELRWIMSVYLLYFFTSIFLDAHYFGFKKLNTNPLLSKNKISKGIERIINNKLIAGSYRVIKFWYFLLSIVLYTLSGLLYFFMMPLPTIDSFNCYLSVDGSNKPEKKCFYYYPVFDNERYDNKEMFVFDEVIINGRDDQDGNRIYEKKGAFFKKLILVSHDLEFCIYVDGEPFTNRIELYSKNKKDYKKAIKREGDVINDIGFNNYFESIDTNDVIRFKLFDDRIDIELNNNSGNKYKYESHYRRENTNYKLYTIKID